MHAAAAIERHPNEVRRIEQLANIPKPVGVLSSRGSMEPGVSGAADDSGASPANRKELVLPAKSCQLNRSMQHYLIS